MITQLLPWALFLCVITALVLFDMGVLSKQPHQLTTREAVWRTAIWVGLALVFGGFVYWRVSHEAALQFVSCYLLEYSLSVDNVFVMILLFRSLRIPGRYQHRVLFWGILGAIVLRAIIISAGTALVYRMHWLLYIFGAFLLVTGVRLFFSEEKEDEASVTDGRMNRWLKKLIPVTDTLDGEHFFTRIKGQLHATPLLGALLAIEMADLVFAMDSIPAIFGVATAGTTPPNTFVIFTSNVFAILGLRTLYFLLSDLIDLFRLLKYGIALILVLIGLKMLVSGFFHVPTAYSLAGIALILAVSILASLWAPNRKV